MAKNNVLPPTSLAQVTERLGENQSERVNYPRFRRAQVQLIHKQMRYELLVNVGVMVGISAVFWEKTQSLYIAAW